MIVWWPARSSRGQYDPLMHRELHALLASRFATEPAELAAVERLIEQFGPKCVAERDTYEASLLCALRTQLSDYRRLSVRPIITHPTDNCR